MSTKANLFTVCCASRNLENGQYQSLGHEKLIRIDRLVNQFCVAEPKVCPPSVVRECYPAVTEVSVNLKADSTRDSGLPMP